VTGPAGLVITGEFGRVADLKIENWAE